jgi:hypothetical protein
MTGHRAYSPAPRLSGLLVDVHRMATGCELQLNDALDYVCDPKRLASIVERSDVLADSSKRQKFESLISESRHGV